ncbi:MAG: hypothetical protein ACSLE6_07475 [Mycobacterium sp.]
MALAVCIGLAFGPSQDVALAETTDSESTSSESVSTDTDDDTVATDDESETGSVVDDETEAENDPEPELAEGGDDTAEPTADLEPEPQPDVVPAPDDHPSAGEQETFAPDIPDPVVAEDISLTSGDDAGAQPDPAEEVPVLALSQSLATARSALPVQTLELPVLEISEALEPVLTADPAHLLSVSPARFAAAAPAAVAPSTPTPPQPLSPIAQVLQLPGQIVNAVLELLDLTAAANSSELPFDIYTPINNLIFGLFREWERLVGLHQPPPVQPALPTMTYLGPTTALTPTVAQFLNAASAQYVLGGTPGDLLPLTVGGFQLSSTNILTGMVGTAWVTPEGQIIVAYQGTTGGSNLLFDPLIIIAQLAADLQVIFTGTTPLAFYDALEFANRVQAEAILQGYTSDDIFVTGHSLGAWEAEFVAQQKGLAGIGFEAPGMNTAVAGNGDDSMFVNIVNYGSPVGFMATDLPGLQPFMPTYVPTGGSKPHYGPIVLIGDPDAATPLLNASQLWGDGLVGSAIFLVSYLGNLIQYHLPGVQAYHLDVTNDPGIVPWFGTSRGIVHEGYGELTIPQLLAAASEDGILV